MVAIWEEILSAGPVGPDDDFFALGGDSLAAVEILEAVARRFGRRLPPTALTAAPTCRALAEMAAAAPGPEDPPFIPMGHGEGGALFLVPGAGGSLHCFEPMLRAASLENPVFGVQLPGPGANAPESIEELAARLLAPLLKAQPRGPYRLAGYSFGGRVAVELARRIVSAGGEVEFLGLFDTYGPGYPRTKSLSSRLGDHLRTWSRLDREGRRSYAREAIGRARDRACRCWSRPPSMPEYLRDDLLYHRELSCRYRPSPYPGRLTVFRAEVEPRLAGSDFSDLFLGWRKVAAGGVGVVPIPGDHFSLLAEPHSRVLALALRSHLAGQVTTIDRLPAQSLIDHGPTAPFLDSWG